MIDLIKNQWIGIVAIVLVAISLASGGTVGNLGASATTITNPWTFAEPTGTTTVTISSTNVGGCIVIEQMDGSGYGYFTADATGSLATTTSSGC